MPAFQPYRGKPAVRNDGEGRGNVGIIRSPVRASTLPDCKPGSVKPHKKFKAEAYILTKEEGGRHTPFFNNYRPQFYFRTTDVTGMVTLPAGTEKVMPGDKAAMDIELITPIAKEEEQRLTIR